MKLLFIYGSPAVGKLTVANEIAARTGFKVFHNHLSIDAVLPVFDFGTKPFFRLINLIRTETVREAARENVDVIYTFCYAKGSDEPHVKEIAEIVEKEGGEVCFVLLKADREELNRRVTEESRRALGKAKTVELMNYFHETYELFSPVPDRESLIIDNSQLSAEKTAEQIIAHFNLAGIDESG